MEIDQAQNPAAEVVSAEAPAATPITEIDGLSEFTFQGEKYNPDRLHQVFNEHKTYAEQLKSHEQEKKFVDNFYTDLESVLERPELASKFKAIYPKKYHAALDRFLQTNGQSPAQVQPAQPALPKEFLGEFDQMKQRLSVHEERAYKAEVEAANAKLDATLPPLFTKFPMAIEEQVYTRAEGILQSGQKLTDKTWERLVRESHEAMQKKADQVYGAKLKAQLQKGEQGKDAGAGGGVPGQAPVKPRTFAEAQEAMLASMQRQKTV